MTNTVQVPLAIEGRFFERKGCRIFLRAVTYGPFPDEEEPLFDEEFARIAAAGFNAVRLYQSPSQALLDCAAKFGLTVLATVPWHWNSLFTRHAETFAKVRRSLGDFLREHGEHPALGALLVANEIGPDLVRFMGPVAVREALEELIEECRTVAPQVLYAYANYPTTEYLEPRNADFTAFNVYLEEREQFARYLRRLQNIAGDRPVLLTEFGFNTHPRESAVAEAELEARQSETLQWALQTSYEEAVAGFTVYAWSDRWKTAGEEVRDWSFGLTRRDGTAKPALQTLMEAALTNPERKNLVSIAICTRNGAERLRENLPSYEQLEGGNFELLIVDDGSSDDTRCVVEEFQQNATIPVRYAYQDPGGLSVARNHAARIAMGDIVAYIDDDARPDRQWLRYIREAFARNPQAAAAGGPNLPPRPIGWQNAVVTACAGNVSHVLFTDTSAEHLPGCNLALRRDVLLESGGFDERFHAAGDDVDTCWRLLDAGYELAFHPAACVSHDRRSTLRKFIRQQAGYGEAEALLYQKHPTRFGDDGIRWEGFIYTGATLTAETGSVIDHGPMGNAPFQMIQPQVMPARLLAKDYRNAFYRWIVKVTERLAGSRRRATRKQFGGPVNAARPPRRKPEPAWEKREVTFPLVSRHTREKVLHRLLEHGWQIPQKGSDVDLIYEGTHVILAQSLYDFGQADLHVRLSIDSGKNQALLNQALEVIAKCVPQS